MTLQSVDPTQTGSSYVARGPAQTASAPAMMDPDPAQIRQIMHNIGLL